MAKGVGSRGLLAPFWASLEEWPVGAVNPAKMQEEYRRFDQRLQEVGRQFGLGGKGR